jgi:hypothetical protein
MWCDSDGNGSAARLVVKVEHGIQAALPLGNSQADTTLRTHVYTRQYYGEFFNVPLYGDDVAELLVSFELFDRAGVSAGRFYMASGPQRWRFEVSATISNDHCVDLNVADILEPTDGASPYSPKNYSLHLFDTVNTEDADPPAGTFVRVSSTQTESCDISVYEQQARDSTTPCIPVEPSIYCDDSDPDYAGRLQLYPWSKDDCTHWVRPHRVTHSQCNAQLSSLVLSFGPPRDVITGVSGISGDYELTASNDLGNLLDNQFWFDGLPHVTEPNAPFQQPQTITRLEISASVITDLWRGYSNINLSACGQKTISIDGTDYPDAIVPGLFIKLHMNWTSTVNGNPFLAWGRAELWQPLSLAFLRGEVAQLAWSLFGGGEAIGWSSNLVAPGFVASELQIGYEPTAQLIQ